jgi:hypothetical protein
MAVGANGKTMWQTGWNDIGSTLTPDGTAWTPEPGTGYQSTYLSGAGGGTSLLYAQVVLPGKRGVHGPVEDHAGR